MMMMMMMMVTCKPSKSETQSELLFGFRSDFISRSVHAGLQLLCAAAIICVCVDTQTQAQIDMQTVFTG